MRVLLTLIDFLYIYYEKKRRSHGTMFFLRT